MANNEGGGTLTKANLESLLTCIFGIADGAGSTKEEMREALERVADLADPDTEVEEVGDGDWQVTEDASDDEADPDADDED